MSPDVLLAIDLILLAVFGGVVSMVEMPSKKWKTACTCIFAILGVAAIVLVFSAKRHENAITAAAVNHERQIQAGIQIRLDKSIRENAEMGAQLDLIARMGINGANKQDIGEIDQMILGLYITNKQIKASTLLVTRALDMFQRQVAGELEGLRDHRKFARAKAIESHNVNQLHLLRSEDSTIMNKFWRTQKTKLQPILKQARITQSQLLVRLKGAPAIPLQPEVQYLLTSGNFEKRGDLQTLGELEQYLTKLASMLPS